MIPHFTKNVNIYPLIYYDRKNVFLLQLFFLSILFSFPSAHYGKETFFISEEMQSVRHHGRCELRKTSLKHTFFSSVLLTAYYFSEDTSIPYKSRRRNSFAATFFQLKICTFRHRNRLYPITHIINFQ